MRQFVRVAALYLQILLLEIIKYSAIMITNQIVDLRGCWRKNSRSVRRAARFLSEAENEYARGFWWRQKQRLVEADMMPGQRAW
jgi:hypothetical protein